MTPRSLDSSFRPEALRALTRELSVWSLLPLAIAIFALFSVLGPVADLFGGAHWTVSTLLRGSLISGLIAVGYAYGIQQRRYVLMGVIVAGQIGWIWLESRAQPATVAPPSPAHLALDGLIVQVQMIVSYTFFLIFINNTARRYLRIRAEVDLAHQIHQVLVPVVETHIGAFEFFGFSRPSGDVGGDLVDVVSGSEGWFGYVADVSGHGVSSGLVMGMFKSALRMRLRHGGTLAGLLTEVNEVLFPLKSGSMFVTVAGVGFRNADPLEFAVAGHLPILRVRDGVVDEITTPQIPIAMFETYPFRSSTLDMRAGDLLALITDGLMEVFDRHDHDFGLERAKALIVDAAGKPLAEIAERLVAAARAHGRQLDDQTVLLIRRT
ncbi:MAG TPA: PP2C family protein-serine/threonine phosphatase [Vicinamibacterales bacterium]